MIWRSNILYLDSKSELRIVEDSNVIECLCFEYYHRRYFYY